jgi:hypothetical protein
MSTPEALRSTAAIKTLGQPLIIIETLTNPCCHTSLPHVQSCAIPFALCLTVYQVDCLNPIHTKIADSRVGRPHPVAELQGDKLRAA